MIIEKNSKNGASVFILEGKIDVISGPLLQEELVREIELVKNIELDFTKVGYISSAGLRVLVHVEKAVKSAGGSMVLLGVSDSIMEIFALTGFKKILTFK